jgi:hypothetical protein
MAYLTEQELLERYKFYTIQLESLLDKMDKLVHVGEQFPFGVHRNDASTLKILD